VVVLDLAVALLRSFLSNTLHTMVAGAPRGLVDQCRPWRRAQL